MIRYRTESFAGSGERNAAEVMAYETFSLGNVDILETMEKEFLCAPELRDRCIDFIDKLQNDGYVEGFSEQDGVNFFKEVLNEISEVTGHNIKYALWLADRETVTGKESGCYGKDMYDEADFECYEVGPVVLSELGFDGTLYGYAELPVSLEEQVEQLQDELTDIINERENDRLSKKRAAFLDDRYLEVDNRIQELKELIQRKTYPEEKKPSLDAIIASATPNAAKAQSNSHVNEKENAAGTDLQR